MSYGHAYFAFHFTQLESETPCWSYKVDKVSSPKLEPLQAFSSTSSGIFEDVMDSWNVDTQHMTELF